MLRHEILSNFIHFQCTKTFNFQSGPNIFIGQNNSGKSSVFEGARRCLGVTQNTSLSSAPYPDKLSSATCIFDIGDKNKFFSSMIRLPTNAAAAADQAVYVKATYETVEQSICIDLVKDTKGTALVNKSVEVSGNSNNELKEMFRRFLPKDDDESPDEAQLQALLEQICTIVSGNVDKFKHSTEHNRIVDTDCERILRKYVDDTTVFTFAVRGIGPCQWSKSDKVTSDCKEQNYKTAQERSEILQWYLKGVKNESIKSEDTKVVDEYFDIITNNSDFKFKIQDNGELVAVKNRSGKRSAGDDSCKPFPIMKVPEGITEAMHSAILLGVSDFKTVCLEEPEKGMHPQMIERLRELVLRQIENKTVLLTSHHPSFLSPWTIPKLYIFKRIDNGNGISFNTVCGSEIEEGYTDKKTPRIITSDHFASVFFAKRVLFVEGEGDFLFMSALKQLFLSNNHIVKDLITPAHLKRFLSFLCSLHLVSLNGETHKLRFRKLCEKIGTESYFLLDYDAILDDKGSIDRFLEHFNLTKYQNDNVLENVSILEEEGWFVWKAGITDVKGTVGKGKTGKTGGKTLGGKEEARKTDGKNKAGAIEDALIELAEKHKELKDDFHDNKVDLKYNRGATKHRRYKLFSSKETTDEHVKNVVEAVMECCVKDKKKKESTEMLRLVDFLIEKSKTTSHGQFDSQ